jgi:deoxycytidylate deaminase
MSDRRVPDSPNSGPDAIAAENSLGSKAELVFGLVYPLGTEVGPVVSVLEDNIRHFGYEPSLIRISEYLNHLNLQLDEEPSTEAERLIRLGNKSCKEALRKDFLALAAASQIAESRVRNEKGEESQPAYGKVYIIRSLKRPDEIFRLRQIYRPGLYTIGVFATEEERVEYLTRRKGYSREQAEHLMRIDESQADEEYGQRNRKTFHLADVFVETKEGRYRTQLERFLDLVFGNPFVTPLRDEHGMFLAAAASMRSAQFGRQVGAAILNSFGDVLSVGCNDVPRAGGGLYWPGDVDDCRDHKRKPDHDGTVWDSNDQVQREIANDILKKIRPRLDASSPSLDADKLFEDTKLEDITEFGRAVHAEMDALLSCMRSGTPPKGSVLYTTTFPCHNCARHIIAAGIERVVYVEPYPKSRASDLHDDAITFSEEKKDDGNPRIPFVPFVGIAPRRYIDLFSLDLSTGGPKKRKTDDGKMTKWSRTVDAVPRVSMLATSYLDREEMAVSGIDEIMRRLEGKGEVDEKKSE